ncbi:MAG: PhzF family phenazine biosynthesis protein [Psychrobium sp.]
MNITAYLVNSFTNNGAGGNPAGVVLNADNLSDAEKLKIAQAIGFSETAFVSHDDEADFDVSFFTTTDEVDFCGHATLAAFSTLHENGVLAAGEYTQRTKAGLLSITIEADGRVVMGQALPQSLGELSVDSIAPLIGIETSVLESTHLPIEIISTGLPDIIVPMPYGTLDKIKLDDELTSEFCKVHNVVGIHAFELDKDSGELTASCRNFAPLFGIPEESATGSASGALACYLTKHVNGNGSSDFVFEQGKAMGCTSRITASIESNEQDITKVLVGGYAQLIKLQEISL